MPRHFQASVNFWYQYIWKVYFSVIYPHFAMQSWPGEKSLKRI